MSIRRVDFVHTDCPHCSHRAEMWGIAGIDAVACLCCWFGLSQMILPRNRSNFGHRTKATGRVRK